MYEVRLKKSALKGIEKMPLSARKRMVLLIADLELWGPIRKEWPNFSSLGKEEYHCHLSHHWVAFWRCEKGSIVIEVYYAGSRENAPY